MRKAILIVLAAAALIAGSLWFGGFSTQWWERPYCRDFSSQAEAQGYYRSHPIQAARMDADGDGVACERLPGPSDHSAVDRKRPS